MKTSSTTISTSSRISNNARHVKILASSSIIRNRFYFATTNRKGLPKSSQNHIYVTFDDTIAYPQFRSYFGPSNLAIIYRYTYAMEKIMRNNRNKIIVHCTSIENHEKRVNAAFLVGVYSIMCYRIAPDKVANLLKSGKQIKYL